MKKPVKFRAASIKLAYKRRIFPYVRKKAVSRMFPARLFCMRSYRRNNLAGTISPFPALGFSVIHLKEYFYLQLKQAILSCINVFQNEITEKREE
ncbi:hypothetical protein XI25_23210 [Paenibacillus sp. DMB20]|nr:hypothetical protein XI25_27030 [Paenibacillus sp. DMB20]KKO51834.1 hypothetical protein XI25_23210 [Paenibacillus sp. DMB20]